MTIIQRSIPGHIALEIQSLERGFLTFSQFPFRVFLLLEYALVYYLF